MTPTEDLVMEVLAARYRLGETWWTFDSRLGKTIRSLADQGFVSEMGGIVEKTIRASLTEAGKAYALDPNYGESEESKRLRVRNAMLAELLELGEPQARGLSTFLSHVAIKAVHS